MAGGADLQSTGPDVITFAYIKGMWYSFPSAHRARMAVQKYTGNSDTITSTKPTGVAINTTLGWKPDGALVDTTTWPNQVFAPEGVTGDALWNPPVNPITTNVAEKEEGGEPIVEEILDGEGENPAVVDDEEGGGQVIKDETCLIYLNDMPALVCLVKRKRHLHRQVAHGIPQFITHLRQALKRKVMVVL